MSFFRTMFALSFKNQLRTRSFWVCSAFLAILIAGFAAAYPAPAPLSTAVGLLCDESSAAARDVSRILLQNEDIEFRRYAANEADAMRRDLLDGTLHCAYSISATQTPPIQAWETDASYLRPIIDESVLAAWYEAQMGKQIGGFLDKRGFAADGTVAQSLRTPAQHPLEIRYEARGQAAPIPKSGLSVAPLLYAILISAFLLCAMLSALLAPVGDRRVLRLLALGSPRHRGTIALVPLLTQSVLFGAVLLVCEGAITLSGADLGYSLRARLLLIVLLAPAAALLSWAAARLRSHPTPLLTIAPIWMILSVACSGAIVSPAFLGAAGVLRFLSPAWWLLQGMTVWS